MKRLSLMLLVIAMAGSFLLIDSCKKKPQDRNTSGTIGQVEKYRKEQMTEKDILLRSEVIENTSHLQEIIKGLTLFSAYTSTLEKSLENRLVDMQTLWGSNDSYDQLILEMSDFRDFLTNNNIVLTNVIMMLVDFHKDTITESSIDVENNLRAFVKYIRQLEEKDSVLAMTVNNLDSYIGEKEKGIVDKEEIAKLKEVRDELLVRIIQQSFFLVDTSAVASVGEKKFYSLGTMAALFDMDQLQKIICDKDPDAFFGKPIGSIILQGTDYIGVFFGARELGFGGGGQANVETLDKGYSSDAQMFVLGFTIPDKDFINFFGAMRDMQEVNYFVNFFAGWDGAGPTGNTFTEATAFCRAFPWTSAFVQNFDDMRAWVTSNGK